MLNINGIYLFFRYAQRLLKRTVNLILFLSLILTSCGPANQAVDTQTPVDIVILPTQTAEIPQENEYIPPVFTQPEPRIGDDANIDPGVGTELILPSDLLDTNIEDQFKKMTEELKSKIDAENEVFQLFLESTFTEADEIMESIKPIPNPVRNIKNDLQSSSKLQDDFSSNDQLVINIKSPKSTGKHIGAPSLRIEREGIIYMVTNINDSDDGVCDNDCTLREAIYAANESAGLDTILFSFSGTIKLRNTLPYIFDPEGLKIDGNGQTITIDGSISYQVLYIDSEASLTLDGITISNGHIYNVGKLTISNSNLNTSVSTTALSTNSSVSPINYNKSIVQVDNELFTCGVYSQESLTISGSVTDCRVLTTGNLSISGSSFIRSYAYGMGSVNIASSTFSGSAVQSDGTLTINTSQFIDGYAESRNSTASISSSSFSSGDPSTARYQTYVYSKGAMTITESTFDFIEYGHIRSNSRLDITNNSYINSTGYCNITSYDSITFTDSANTSSGWGSSMQSSNNFTITNSSITSNGNLSIQSYAGEMKIENSYLYLNGGIGSINASLLKMINSPVLANSEPNSYFSIYGNAKVFLTNSPIDASSGQLALYFEDDASIINSNLTSSSGYIINRKSITLSNSNISFTQAGEFHNSYDRGDGNGARVGSISIFGENSLSNIHAICNTESMIHIDTEAALTISNSTFTNCKNISNQGSLSSINNTFVNSDIANGANLDLYNTILANESTCQGVINDGKNNLIYSSGDNACGLLDGVNGNIIGSNANLVFPPISSGIVFYYYELNYSSPAIDAGDDAICAAAPINNTSQNGLTRPQGIHCDIGAFEADPVPEVDDSGVVSSCSIDDCINTSGTTQYETENPINTRTGGFQYSVEDISLPTTAGQLSITRDYASLGIPLPTTLSPGWTHNQDTRLILPDDPGGKEGAILFKLHSSNQFKFNAQTDGTYQAAPGLLVTLVKQIGPPTTYVITDSSQNTFTFDENGSLLTYSDPTGNEWEYTYTTTGLLETISANEGTTSLAFAYDAESHLTSIIDQTGRNIIYGYDANGDLSSVTDILGQTWTYTYDSAHRLTAALDPNGIVLERNEYDEQGRVVRQYDGNGNLTVALTYNTDGTTTVTDALDNSSIHTYDVRGTLINETDPGGNASETTYLADFRPFRLTDEQNRITDLSWSADGANLTRLVDNEGNQINITYDTLNNPLSLVDSLNYLTTYEFDGTLLTSITDALNKETTYTYTPEGYLESVTDPLGNTTSYTYNSQGQQISMTDPIGNKWIYSYDELGRLVDTTDPLLRVSHNEYEAAGRLIQTVQNYDAARSQNDENLWNIITTYAYDVRNNQISVTDTYGRTTRYEYDLADRMVKTIDPAGQESIYTYDAAGNLVSTTDVKGQITQYEYDALSRLIKTTDPLGNITQTIYNPDGTIASSIDPLGGTTSYTYDNLGRVSATTQPDGTITYNAYDAAGNLVAVKDALGNITQYEYDALSRLIKTTDPLGGYTENFYDDAGRLVQTKDALGNATTYVYNNAGQLLNQTDPEGHVTSFEYDALGRRIAVTDALGNRTAYTYDLLDRVVSATDPLGGITYTSYDAMGTVISQKDANGNETLFGYDILNRLTTQINALGNSTSYTYDDLGNQLSVTDPLGRISYMEYDALGQMIKQIDPAGGVTTFTYDLAGNLLTTTDPNGHSTSMTYDVMGRMIGQTDANGITTTFAYDAGGNLLSQTDNAGNQTRFVYDALNRQGQSIDPLGSISYSYYDANSNLVGKIDANGIATQYDYNKVGNLIAVIENVNPNGVVDNQTNVRTEYTYDANGNLLTIKDARGITSSTFSYDALNRRVTEFDAFNIPTFYTYDAVGNLVSKTDPTNGPTTYLYDQVNQLVKIDYQGNSIDVNFTYNAAGERTQMTDNLGATTWTYNTLGLPTAITDPYQKTVNYSYDAAGNKTSLIYPDGKTVQYAYDPGNRLASMTDWQNLVTDYSYNTANLVESVTLPNSLTTTYGYDAASRVTSILHASPENEIGSYTYSYDALGNRTQAVERLVGADRIPVISVTVKDVWNYPQIGLSVYAFNGSTYTGFSAITDSRGVAKFILPEGSYRFRADVSGYQYFSNTENHCTVLGCTSVDMVVPGMNQVDVNVTDSTASPQAGLPVYVFDGTIYKGISGITDENGSVSFILPDGSYRFRADKNGEQFFSSTENDCDTSECTSSSITVPQFENVLITVTNTAGAAQADIPVYAFDGATYTGYHAVTDADGHAELLLREGNYRFRADLNGLQYFSANENHCTVTGCESASITVPVFGQVTVSISNTAGTMLEGLPVYAFDETTYKGFSGTTDSSGQVTLTLPEGNYRFRSDLNGGQFFSGANNHCIVPECMTASITMPQYEIVMITVNDSNGVPQTGLPVYAFDGATYTGYNSTTDENGQVVLLLKEGSYHFRADLDGQQYFSADVNHCTVMGCTSASITLPAPVPTETPTATPTETPTETPTPTPSETPIGLYLNLGKVQASFVSNHKNDSHRLADELGTIVTVTITDTTGVVLTGLPVYVFDGTTYKDISGISDANGQVVFTLADGNYRFRTDRFNRQYFSGAANTCSTPVCTTDSISVPVFGQVAVTIKNSAGEMQSGLNVYAFNGTTYTGFSSVSGADGLALFNLPEGNYRFRADTHGLQYFSSSDNHCSVPTCSAAEITVPLFGALSVNVINTTGTPQADLPVYVFNGTTYTGFSARTDAAGLVQLTLPEGNYRFRTDLNGAQYFSNTANHCAIPTCTHATITTPVYGSVTISVMDSASNPLSGLPVYAFNGATYTGKSGTTDASGQVTLNLPEGNYRFRSDLNGQQYFSAAANHCSVPSCISATITAAVFGEVTITVADGSGALQAGLPVYAFTGSTYTGFNGTTDENGQVTLNLPQNNYRFRADLHGAQYFSSTDNACAVPACTTANVITPVYGQVTISVQSSQGQGQPDLPVYVFDGTTYTGLSGITDANGSVTLWISAGSYRFRADQFELQFFSADENHCTAPECTSAMISTLGMQQVEVNQTIEYTYDPLNRLTSAVYDDGSFYQYTYDAVGNRLTETTPSGMDTYTYNENNWVVQKNGTSWSYDPAGNLRSDGVRNYDYDAANRLKWVSDRSAYVQTSYAYNGLGDRLQSTLLYYPTGESTTTNYTLDLNTNLTQVLADGRNTYTYGYNRIAQISDTQTGYFLGDALGSVRQVADELGAVNLVQSYSPYGEVISNMGDYETAFTYTGEVVDGTGLVFLRARYYDPATGRFLNKDAWGGDYNNPITLNKWAYAIDNPILYSDPSGNDPISECLVLFTALSIVDGPLPVGEVIGIASCLTLLGSSLYLTNTLAQKAPEIAQEVENGCRNWVEWLYTRPVLPDPQQTPTPETKMDPFPIPYAPTLEVTETPNPKKFFYYHEVGAYPSPGRPTNQIIIDLGTIVYIPGINGYIGQLAKANGSMLMGRKFEAERAIYFYNHGILVEVNSTSDLFDIKIQGIGSIQFIEEKWSAGTISKSTLNQVINQANKHTTGTFMLETTYISIENKKYLESKGGIEFP